MKHTIILLSLLSFSISFAQDVVGVSLSGRSSDPKIVLTQKTDSCLAIICQKKSDTIYDCRQLRTTEYFMKNSTLDTIFIKSIRCQASDQMPIWKHTYLLPGQIDTLKIVSNFRYLKTNNSAGTTQVSRTAIIETDNCKQTLEMKFYFNTTQVENIRTNKTNYKTNDSLVIISDGFFSSDGGCIPKPYWGLEKLEDKIWKQAFDLRTKPKMCCGPGSYRFINQNDCIAIFSLKEDLNYFTFFEKGTYRVYTFNEDDQFIYSNIFTYE